MAESQVVVKEALKKLEDQLTCAICLDVFKDPKLLQCFHVYCKECLEQLVVQDHQGQLSLRCPTCRQSTLLPPATGVSGLLSAFHIHHLLEIKDALEKMREPQKVKCDKCKPHQPATSYCRDCGEFICAICTAVHSRWDAFTKHEVVALEEFESKTKQLDTLKKVTLYCSLHQDKELELYCETCEELICHNCTVKKHKEHHIDLVRDSFERHKSEITSSLEGVEEKLNLTCKALEQLNTLSQYLDDQKAAIEGEIKQEARQLVELVEARKERLLSQVDGYMKMKKKNLATQRGELDTLQTQLASCLSFVRESLKRGSEGEVMKMTKGVMKQIKEMTDNFKPDMLVPCEIANVKFTSSLLSQVEQTFQSDEIFLQATPERCHATGKGLEVAEPGERATATVHVVDHKGNTCLAQVENLSSALVSDTSGKKKVCSIRKTGEGEYKVSYVPTDRGKHQLHIKVAGSHIKGSPFPVAVKLPVQKLGIPIKTISGVGQPYGVTINQSDELIVAESKEHCISIFSPSGERLRSFGSKGSRPGQFNSPRGVAVDRAGNILVVDRNNHRIQKLTPSGECLAVQGRLGDKPFEFNQPYGIAVHPLNEGVYIAERYNNRIHVLNADLTVSSSFGWKGSHNGEFQFPWDIAFDKAGNVYVADSQNHRIQVFTAGGVYLRQFGRHGTGEGELNFPTSIAIDCDDKAYVTEDNNHRVSVFTCKGKFLTSFGSCGHGSGQFDRPRGIAVDKDGNVYVSDCENHRLQCF